jgi:sulfite exporter TauE/SafE
VSGWIEPVARGLHTGGVTANADLLLFLVIGALGGAHCLGMCGPLVSTYADRITASGDDRRRDQLTVRDVRQHGLFNLGRTAGYAVVGAVLGLAGSLVVGSVTAVTSLSDVVRGSMGILVGLFILAAGVGYLFRGTAGGAAVGNSIPVLSGVFRRVSGVLTGHLDRATNSTGIVGLGAVHAALPCPITYPAYLYAFVIGDPFRGALALALLGVGTIPTLLAYGLAIGSLSVRNRTLLHRTMGVAFLALGYLPFAHGLMLFGIHLPHPPVPYYQPL